MIARTPMIEAAIATLGTSLQTLESLPGSLSRTQIAQLGVVGVDVTQASAVLRHAPGLEPAANAAEAAHTAMANLTTSAASATVDATGLLTAARVNIARTIAAAESTIAASSEAGQAADVCQLLRTAVESSSTSLEHGALGAVHQARELVDDLAHRVRASLAPGADPYATYRALGELEHLATGIESGLQGVAASWTNAALANASDAARMAHENLRLVRDFPEAVSAAAGASSATKHASRTVEHEAERVTTAVDTLVARLDLEEARHRALADARSAVDQLLG